MSTNQHAIVEKLIEIRRGASANSVREIAAITALGRAGGYNAVEHLLGIVTTASANSNREIAAIAALGEAARVE